MMRSMPWRPTAIRYALGACLSSVNTLLVGRLRRQEPLGISQFASCAFALVGALSLTGHAGQSRSPADGVYSAGQAARGRQLYQAQCAECHGNAMEGASGPPLVGEGFLSNWSARPLADLVDKIQKTMPFNLPGDACPGSNPPTSRRTCSRPASFPPDQSSLSDATLAQIAFPAARHVARARRRRRREARLFPRRKETLPS